MDYMFHTLYVIFAIAGAVYSYLFFIFHLMDLLRIDVLKNIVSAIWIRRVPLVLTFMLFLLLEYYFTLIGFLLFHDQYPNKRCFKLSECFFETFDL